MRTCDGAEDAAQFLRYANRSAAHLSVRFSRTLRSGRETIAVTAKNDEYVIGEPVSGNEEPFHLPSLSQ